MRSIIVAMRGKNPENPSDRRGGQELQQRLEPNTQNICNTLTSVQKDNLVLEISEPSFSHHATRTEIKTITTKGKIISVAATILCGYERTNMTGWNADNAVLEIYGKSRD